MNFLFYFSKEPDYSPALCFLGQFLQVKYLGNNIYLSRRNQ